MATTNGAAPPAQKQDGVSPQQQYRYSFPDHKLKQVIKDSSKTPLVLVACGSFSPITYLHLRMFEMVSDYIRLHTKFELVGGYLSPVSDAYKKKGLALAEHRIRMCQMASESAPLLMVDPWEALLPEYTRTAAVLDHFRREINEVRGGAFTPDGTRKGVQIALLAGADLIETFLNPGVWSDEDLHHILANYGTFIVERSGTDLDQALAQLNQPKDHIYVVRQLVKNDVSSTKVRDFISKDMSIHYLIPPDVIRYIDQNDLYKGDRLQSRTGLASALPEDANRTGVGV